VFGPDYIRRFFREFRQELSIAAIATVILYIALMFFQSRWLLISRLVSAIIFRILSMHYDVLFYTGTGAPIIGIRGFEVAIGAPCSGIDSMLLFTLFFAALFALDHARIRKRLYLLLFIPGLVGVFIVNIIRLLLLILVGVYISPEFAVGMFHTQAGWLLFVIYFLCYYWLIKTFIYKS